MNSEAYLGSQKKHHHGLPFHTASPLQLRFLYPLQTTSPCESMQEPQNRVQAHRQQIAPPQKWISQQEDLFALSQEKGDGQ
jgi:hypothetical protein